LANAVKTSQTDIFMKLQQTQLDGFVLLQQYSLGYNNKINYVFGWSSELFKKMRNRCSSRKIEIPVVGILPSGSTFLQG